MTSHSGRSFLNSCLKVPIDPCNNCPAPIYNRPKMYLGRLSMTPTTAVPTTVITTKTCDTETDPKWSCSGIRSLAKFYDSIPDYGELNHLTEEEFYSTLDTLRSTCRDLKIKSVNSCPVVDDRCSTTSSSLSSSHCFLSGSQSKKPKKAKKKKKSSGKPKHRNHSESQESESILGFTNTRANVPDSVYTTADRRTYESCTSKSLKKDLDEEVEVDRFRKSLKDYESKFKRPATSSVLNRNESRSFTRCTSKDPREKTEDFNKKTTGTVPARTTYTSTLRERLRKSLSFNDLHSITDPPELTELRNKTKTLEKLAFKGNSNAYKDPSKLSNYFQENLKSDITGNLPKIVVDTPTTDSSTERPVSDKRSKNKSNDYNYKIPFKIFDLDSSKREGSTKNTTPSPVHPVARPNLAATLRVECSKKKVKELKNNCTYHDLTPQVDWEVRKTPAWKTLSLNETHKEIIKLRLATRKAEQDLQKREYELNMELMRQRVKSAPLLLEGPTHWGPDVGKLTHSCQRDGRRHMCQSNQQRMRRKKNSSRSHSCRRGLFHHSDPGLDYERYLDAASASNVNRPQESARMSQKLNTLRKIYGGNATAATKSHSRCSNNSTNTPHSSKSYVVKNKPQEKKSAKPDPNLVVLENDSADELSSLDRAFL